MKAFLDLLQGASQFGAAAAAGVWTGVPAARTLFEVKTQIELVPVTGWVFVQMTVLSMLVLWAQRGREQRRARRP